MTTKIAVRKRLIVAASVIAAVLMPLVSTDARSADAKMPTAKIGNHLIKLEVASSEAEIEKGLMFRTSMPEDQGMVFLFHPPRKVRFWMCHTLIPLDMMFIDKGKIVKISHDAKPCKSENCTDCDMFPSDSAIYATHVIEVNGGYTERHSIKEGDTVDMELR
jgi:uncharacterized membrane protein (UPF0127 family)